MWYWALEIETIDLCFCSPCSGKLDYSSPRKLIHGERDSRSQTVAIHKEACQARGCREPREDVPNPSPWELEITLPKKTRLKTLVHRAGTYSVLLQHGTRLYGGAASKRKQACEPAGCLLSTADQIMRNTVV